MIYCQIIYDNITWMGHSVHWVLGDASCQATLMSTKVMGDVHCDGETPSASKVQDSQAEDGQEQLVTMQRALLSQHKARATQMGASM